jgi:hypothetical protein
MERRDMRKLIWSIVLLASAAALSACGDDTGGGGGAGGSDDGGSGGMSSMSMSSGTSDATTGATTSSTTSTTGGLETPAAPVLDAVEPMHMALHVMWTNVADDCDEVEGERMVGDTDFEVFFTVPGTVDNEADDEATDGSVVYTYRLRCRRGDAYSDYSNELSASPE